MFILEAQGENSLSCSPASKDCLGWWPAITPASAFVFTFHSLALTFLTEKGHSVSVGSTWVIQDTLNHFKILNLITRANTLLL